MKLRLIVASKMSKAIVPVLAALILLGMSGRAAAQEGTAAAAESVLSRSASNHWRVRVVHVEMADTATGTVRQVRSEYRIGNVLIDPSRVVAIDRELHRGNGFLPGAALGGLIMFAAGSDLPHADGVLEAGALGVLGALVGGWIGHAVSPGRREWVSVWP